jgi:hypothetical protein
MAKDEEGIIMVAPNGTRRLALLVLLAVLVLAPGCAGGEGANPAEGGADTATREPATGGTGDQAISTPGTPGGGQGNISPNAPGVDQDSGAIPSGGPHTGAGGMAPGANVMLFMLGSLIAAGSAVMLVLRRRAVG